MNKAAPWIAIVAAAAAASALRLTVVEPAAIAHLCDAGDGPWWCVPRRALVLTFASNGLGYASLAAGLIATATRGIRMALAAALVGAAGLVLYCYEPSAVGLVLGTLVLARTQRRQQDGRGEQQA
jgi:hypothetical protein